MNQEPIFFLGGGHGGIAALHSLQVVFSSIEIFSEDIETRALARQSDRLCSSLGDIQSCHGVMAGHVDILPASFLARHNTLNVHYSLLPKYRGLHSVAWAMLNLESELGLTVHLANQYIDDGPIIYQHRFPYLGENSREIMDRLDSHVAEKLGWVVREFIDGRLSAVPQDKSVATWVPRRNLEDCIVDFNWEADRLRALFRVLVRPYPLPALVIAGERFEIADAFIVDSSYFCDVGRVVNLDDDGAWIKCADSLLVVRRLLDHAGTEREPSGILRLGMRLGAHRS